MYNYCRPMSMGLVYFCHFEKRDDEKAIKNRQPRPQLLAGRPYREGKNGNHDFGEIINVCFAATMTSSYYRAEEPFTLFRIVNRFEFSEPK